MSENEHRGIRDLSQYDSMHTEALEQILRADAETPAEQESDVELILYIMEVLARRKKENQQSGKTAQQSWESFQQHYLPEQEIQKQNAKTLSGRPWLRRIVACAAVVILILCIPLSSRALSLEELWDIVARWMSCALCWNFWTLIQEKHSVRQCRKSPLHIFVSEN